MNKAEFIAAIAEETGLSRADAERAVNAYHSTIATELRKDEKIALVGFGTYQVSHRAARQGRNPRTGEVINIAAARVPVFKAGKGLKDDVKEG